MKANVHAGHNNIVRGAKGYLDEVTEDRKVKNYLIEYLRNAGWTVYDCTDEKGASQNANLANIVKACNKHAVDYDISIHLNAGGGTGVEVLNYDERTKAMSDKICANISKALGIRNRGTKYNKELYVLRNTNSLAMLVECCFVDSKTDRDAWDAKKCAKAIAEALTGKAVSGVTESKPSTTPSKPTTTASYYPKFNSTSIVDGLKSIGVDSSMSNRKKIAAANGIKNYTGTADQNSTMLALAKAGRLKKTGSTASASYYPKFNSTSIVDGLKSIGVNSSFGNRQKIAAANGIKAYAGTAEQNERLLNLARAGKLKKA